MTITMALLESLEDKPSRCTIVNEAKVIRLLTDATGVIGVEYSKTGKTHQEFGGVIIATGGYSADYTDDSLLRKYRPDLIDFPTTNGEHCTGDGIKMAIEIGAGVVDMEWVQVHPTGLVHPDDVDAKVKWLAAEALRGVGGIMIDRHGKRFVNELGTRDYVSAEMLKRKEAQGPYRLLINGKGSKEIEWHCHHYASRKLMKKYASGEELAREMKIDANILRNTMNTYSVNGAQGKDEHGKKYFDNLPFFIEDNYYVAIVCPVVHYSMGGLCTNSNAEVLDTKGKAIPGLWVTGEACGGIHGKNRMGGNSLLDCVVWGRLSGQSACAAQLKSLSNLRIETLVKHIVTNEKPTQVVDVKQEIPVKVNPVKSFSMSEVALHNKESDCWIVVNGEVIDATPFLNKHPGGKQVLLLWSGKDASTEFNMFHKKDAIKKYAPEIIIGTLEPSSNL
jgi:flavocytochrome c